MQLTLTLEDSQISKLAEELATRLNGKGVATAAAEAEDDLLGPAADSKKYTLADVQDAIKESAAAVGKEKVKALLKKYGVERGTDLDAAKYAEFIADSKKLKK